MGRRVYWFEKEEVTMVLPAGLNIGVRKWQQLPSLKELQGPPDTKQPHRLVIGFEFYDPSKEMSHFDQLPQGEAELRIRWHPEDVENAGGDYQNLQLYYFYNKVWQPFDRSKHRFMLIPDPGNNLFGWGVAYINNWEDPPIAWDA